jgi:hypothetical protein
MKPSIEEQKRAYDKKAIELLGNRARINFPRETYKEYNDE